MPDIAMCFGDNCPAKELCYRYTAKADEYQSYFANPPFNNNKCEFFWGEQSVNFWEEITKNKEEQKKLLIETMEADEKDGLYKTNNMAQQTAVEWYYEQTVIEGKTNYFELLEQAKQMEKEQIVNAWMATDNELQRLAAEQYYNETYGK